MSRARAKHATRTRPSMTLRRVRALLAGGLVLGVGATMTLASWTDNEYAKATLSASTFGVQGSTDGTTFSDHATSGAAATLVFTAPASALALSPGTSVYTSYWVRTLNPSIAGTVQLMTPTFTGTGLETSLTYRVQSIAAATTCNAAAFSTGTAVVPANTALTATLATTPVAIAANQATTLRFCVEITMPAATASTAQGLSTVPTWQLAAVSS